MSKVWHASGCGSQVCLRLWVAGVPQVVGCSCASAQPLLGTSQLLTMAVQQQVSQHVHLHRVSAWLHCKHTPSCWLQACTQLLPVAQHPGKAGCMLQLGCTGNASLAVTCSQAPATMVL